MAQVSRQPDEIFRLERRSSFCAFGKLAKKIQLMPLGTPSSNVYVLNHELS